MSDEERYNEWYAKQPFNGTVNITKAAALHFMREEREALAQMVEKFLLGEDVDGLPVYATDVAAAIRARGEKA